MLIVREPNVRILSKNVTLEWERYTAECLYIELHFDKMHACCMVQCFKVPLQTDNFDQISRCILHSITAKVKYVSEFFLLCLISY